ncbi:MAG TPA: asparaginase [Chloroflexota bacterium]|jgi:L-asparaginase
MVETTLPRVRLGIGPGTLHSQGKDRLDLVRYNSLISGKPRLTGEELLDALPEIGQFARVDVDPGNPHETATPDNLAALARHVEAVLQGGEADGLVFVQGTNTIEETAFFLNLTVHTDKPLVVTGAQRPFTALSSDGALNLINAIRVAGAAEARGQGVLVVTNDEINAARDVTKTHTYRLQTFRSRDLGVLGYADPDRIVFYRTPTRRHTAASEFDLRGIERLPQVDVLYVHSAARPALARAAVDLGARGLVIAGSGAGSTAPLREELAAIARDGVVVVRSARVGEGRVIHDDNWQEPGMVAADNLNPQKAALLLALALTRTGDPDAIQRMFDEY